MMGKQMLKEWICILTKILLVTSALTSRTIFFFFCGSLKQFGINGPITILRSHWGGHHFSVKACHLSKWKHTTSSRSLKRTNKKKKQTRRRHMLCLDNTAKVTHEGISWGTAPRYSIDVCTIPGQIRAGEPFCNRGLNASLEYYDFLLTEL